MGVLNSSNRALSEQIFEKPTPHCQIRYQDIESLFGERTGKLPGGITSAGGSHGKICIQSTVGFFDEFYASETNTPENGNKALGVNEFEEKTQNAEITGGAFKAHKSKAQGSSKLSSIAIKMVCSTLARVGIKASNIASYNQSLQKATLKTS